MPVVILIAGILLYICIACFTSGYLEQQSYSPPMEDNFTSSLLWPLSWCIILGRKLGKRK